MSAHRLALATVLAVACGEQAGAPPPAPPAAAPDGGWFADVTAASGVDFVHAAGITAEKHLPETMGAGAALVDLDGDGSLDIYLVQGGPLRPGPDPAAPRPTNQLLLNDGTGHFADATRASGDAADTGYGMGVAAGDVEGDGDADLLVTNFGPDRLLLNDGAARFTDDTAHAGVGDPRWTGAATFFDADADGDLDLYVAAYVEVDLDAPLWCGSREPGWRSYCHPDAYAGLPDRFWRNRGDGTFEDVTAEAGLATAPGHHGKGLGVIAIDVDDDADLDLYVANDSVENRLWLNRGDGTFDDGTLLSGTGVNGRGLTEAGMGVASGDVDGDRRVDLFVTNFDDESNTLYRNEGSGMFRDVTASAGLDGSSRLPVGFGTVASDLDADGDLDIAVTNGHIVDNVHLYHDGKTHAQRALLFVNDGHGHFTDETNASGALGSEPRVGRGLYAGDVDADGDQDLLLTTCGGPALLLENRHPQGASVILRGLAPGTRVRADLTDGSVLVRDAGSQTSYFGQGSPWVHLGLGERGLLRLTLTGPGGADSVHLLDPPVRKGVLLFQGSGEHAGRDAPLRLQSPAQRGTMAPSDSSSGDTER